MSWGDKGARLNSLSPGIIMTPLAMDASDYVSFAGTNYRVGNAWRRRSAQVCLVAGSVQLSIDGQIVRVRVRRPGPASRLHLSMSVCIYAGLGRLDFG